MRKVIDIETLEVFKSMRACANKLNVRPASIFGNILFKHKTKGRRFEYFDEWLHWTSQEKEKNTRKNNIYFY
jgi:hypothetical protein